MNGRGEGRRKGERRYKWKMDGNESLSGEAKGGYNGD